MLHRKRKIGQHEPHLKPTINNTNTTQKTKDWATRTTLKTNDKQHKILHRKLKIGQHERHYKTQDKEHKILHRKLQIGQHEPH